MRTQKTLTFSLLGLVTFGLVGQSRPEPIRAGKVMQPATKPTFRPLMQLTPRLKASLLPAGKTQGTFHLAGIVRSDRTVVLRWANDQGEIPTEGVHVFRQKDGDSKWKDLTGRKPIGYLMGRQAEKRLDDLPDERREDILAFPFGDVAHDPGTRLKLQPVAPGKGQPRKARDLSMEKSRAQFRTLRGEGRLNRVDLQLMHLQSDADDALAEILGLSYTDDPGRGKFRYKVVIDLPEGGSVEVVCPKVFDTKVPTPIPQAINLTAASGNGEVLLNWDETPSEAVAGYHIYRSESQNGPWKRINADPVKRVELEIEDPELTLRKSAGLQQAMSRMLRPLPEAARTPQKVQEAHALALESIENPANLPQLNPAVTQQVREAVTSGRLRGGGVQAPRSLYTDTRRTEGNQLQDEKTYYYKVNALDIGGKEQELDTAPVVPGIPKDLTPPAVPGRPALEAEQAVITQLRAAQGLRAQDARLSSLNQQVASALPKGPAPFTPFQLSPAASLAPGVKAAPPSPTGGLSLSEAKRQRLYRTASTMPIGKFKLLAEASVIHSNPDGSVPPARLTWEASPDSDLKAYEVHRATGNGSFSKVAEVSAATWTDSDLVPGQFYRYAITSVDTRGNVSARSPLGRVEISDSSLPGRLAIQGLGGSAVQSLPTLTLPSRRLIPPQLKAVSRAGLRTAKVPLKMARESESIVAEFRAPKTKAMVMAPAKSVTLMKPISKVALAPELKLSPAVQTPKFVFKPAFRKVARSLNPMRMIPAAPKELHVVLNWAKPLEGMPLEYVVQQAPQRMELVRTQRPVVNFQAGVRAFGSPATPDAVKPVIPAGTTLKPTLILAQAALPQADEAPKNMVRVTPTLHAAAAKGLVAVQGAGLRFAETRKGMKAHLVAKTGPGLFARINDVPLTSEHFVVTFPAETAQYGGASFYYRVQTFTKEFGKSVEGPLSEPLEVRLPDIVPPPSPLPGSLDLLESSQGKLRVALDWSSTRVRDFKGVVVERQPFAYSLVDGEAQAGAALGEPERLTPEPLGTDAFQDLQVKPGYFRYTFRSVDHTGNVSDPQGHMDILIPGEPVPQAPGNVQITGSQITWNASADAAGYTVWRSFTGQDGDWECISGILSGETSSFQLPAEGSLHLRVVARSASGMHGTPSSVVTRNP